MAVNTIFATKLAAVTGAVTLAYVSTDTAGHGDLEFSYSYSGGVYTITSSSEAGCEQGASHLLYNMGFRFYAPHPSFHVTPVSIPTNLSAVRQRYWMFANNLAQTYGHSFPSPNNASSTTLTTNVNNWQMLNGWRHVPKPLFVNGHRWSNITLTNGVLNQFFVDYPQLLISGDRDSFDLANLVRGSADYERLTDYCALRLLTDGFNDFGTTNFDASDGDTNSSNDVFQFSVDVCIKCRAGVSTIGGVSPSTYGLTAKSGVANARLGVYSYAGHKNAPSFDIRPYIFVGIALGFSSASTFLPRMQQFANVCDIITARDYSDTHTWSYGRPLVNGKMKSVYADTYDGYHTAGCVGTHTEGSGNWLVNLVGMWQFVNKLHWGTYSYTDAVNDVVDDLFNGDQAVKDLYNYWGNQYNTYSEFSLQTSFEYVQQMADSWYKTLFKYLMVINFEYEFLPERKVDGDPLQNTGSDLFPAAYSKMMAHVTAVRDLDIFHSYAHLRSLGRAYVGNTSSTSDYDGYEYLAFELTPKPDFYNNPYLPTDQDFDDAYAFLQTENVRATGVDPSDPADLVVMHNIPLPFAEGTQATAFRSRSASTFYFYGPGTVTVSGFDTVPGEGDGDSEEVPRQEDIECSLAQLYIIQLVGTHTVTHTGGKLFAKYFPTIHRDTLVSGNGYTVGDSYVYWPTLCEGEVRMKATSNLRVRDASGYTNINGTNSGDLLSIGPGLGTMDNINSSGVMSLTNMNPYVSLKRDYMLMAKSIAETDFPALCKINKV